MSQKRVVQVVILGLLFWTLALPAVFARDVGDERAGADGAQPGRQPDIRGRFQREFRDRDERREMLGRVMQLLDKVQKGEQLTNDDKQLVERARGLMNAVRGAEPPARAAGGAVDPAAAGPLAAAKPGDATNRLKHDERLNVIDAAYYQIAEIHLAKKQYEKAVSSLEQLLKSSPDARALSLTHLNLATIYRKQLNNTDKAVAEYKKVTGEYAAEAQEQLTAMLEELDQVDRAVAELEDIAKNSTDSMQKVLALRRLSEVLLRNGREDEAIDALQRIVKAVTYDDAQKIAKALVDEQDRRDREELKDQERARLQMMRNFQRFAGRRPGAPEPDMRPAAVRPAEPKPRTEVRPTERPIEPAPGLDLKPEAK